jgi:hypothetical protein
MTARLYRVITLETGQLYKEGRVMGLSWQQGPFSPGAIGRFLVPEPLPKRLLYAEPLRRRMRVRFGGTWIADSEDVLLLFEPGHYPMAFPGDRRLPTRCNAASIQRGIPTGHILVHRAGRREECFARGVATIDLPVYAKELQTVAFARPAMDALMRKMNGSWAMLPTATTASTSAVLS